MVAFFCAFGAALAWATTTAMQATWEGAVRNLRASCVGLGGFTESRIRDKGDSQFGLHGFANFQSILPTAIRVFLFGGNQGYYPRPMCHVGVELGVWGLSFHGIPIGAMQLVCFGVVVQGCTVQTLGSSCRSTKLIMVQREAWHKSLPSELEDAAREAP